MTICPTCPTCDAPLTNATCHQLIYTTQSVDMTSPGGRGWQLDVRIPEGDFVSFYTCDACGQPIPDTLCHQMEMPLATQLDVVRQLLPPEEI